MIGSIGNIVLNFVIGLVNLILVPLDLIIDSFFPDISSLLSNVSNMITTLLGPTFLYILDLLLIPKPILSAIATYLMFKVTVTISTYAIKLAIQWYSKLKI